MREGYGGRAPKIRNARSQSREENDWEPDATISTSVLDERWGLSVRVPPPILCKCHGGGFAIRILGRRESPLSSSRRNRPSRFPSNQNGTGAQGRTGEGAATATSDYRLRAPLWNDRRRWAARWQDGHPAGDLSCALGTFFRYPKIQPAVPTRGVAVPEPGCDLPSGIGQIRESFCIDALISQSRVEAVSVPAVYPPPGPN